MDYVSEEQLKLMIEILNEKFSKLQIESIAAESAARIWKSKYEELLKQHSQSKEAINVLEKQKNREEANSSTS